MCLNISILLPDCVFTCCWKAPKALPRLCALIKGSFKEPVAAAWRKTAFMYGLVQFHISLQLPEPRHGVAILYFDIN